MRLLKDNSAAICVALGLAAWLGNALYAVGAPAGLLKEWSPALVAGAMLAFFAIHGRRSHSDRRLFLFALTVFLVGWFFETFSVMTGFPFGNYHYTEIMGPFLGHVPVSVMPAYCVMGYASWCLARLLLGRTGQNHDGIFRYGVPVLAAGLMVVWDLSMDPLRATLEGRWIWLDGGIHFGVPVANFFGWALVTWIMFQIFALSISAGDRPAKSLPVSAHRLYWLSVPLIYSAFAGEYLLNPFVTGDSGNVMVDGAILPAGDLFEAVALLTATTMLPLALIGALTVGRIENSKAGPLQDDEPPALAADRAGWERE